MKPFLNPNLLNPAKTYVVAVSFGPDSMALLHLLQQLAFKIEVAHVNYHLRKESDLEQSQLEQYCLVHDLPLHILDVSKMPKGNLQAQARKIRYDFFNDLVNTLHAEGILTAHHQDDDLETAMMQIQRSNLYEYFGIRPVGFWDGVKVYRPLLDVSKQALMDYCSEHHIPYSIDLSNTKLIYQRNRIRAELNKLTVSEQDKKRKAFQEANQLRQQILQSLQPFMAKRSIPIAQYQQWDILKRFLYWVLLNQTHGIFFPITESWLNKIQQILTSQKPNIFISFARGWHLEKAYDHIWLVKNELIKPYRFKNPKGTVRVSGLIIDLERMPQLPKTFILRSCKPNDLLMIKTYAKPFRRLAIDWKMPLFLRRVWPVFTTPNGDIILLPRYQKNYDFKANNWLEILE